MWKIIQKLIYNNTRINCVSCTHTVNLLLYLPPIYHDILTNAPHPHEIELCGVSCKLLSTISQFRNVVTDSFPDQYIWCWLNLKNNYLVLLLLLWLSAHMCSHFYIVGTLENFKFSTYCSVIKNVYIFVNWVFSSSEYFKKNVLRTFTCVKSYNAWTDLWDSCYYSSHFIDEKG